MVFTDLGCQTPAVAVTGIWWELPHTQDPPQSQGGVHRQGLGVELLDTQECPGAPCREWGPHWHLCSQQVTPGSVALIDDSRKRSRWGCHTVFPSSSPPPPALHLPPVLTQLLTSGREWMCKSWRVAVGCSFHTVALIRSSSKDTTFPGNLTEVSFDSRLCNCLTG